MAVDDQLVQDGVLAADEVAIGFRGTDAEKTRAVVRRALEALEANGLITVTPVDERPMFFAPFPPYEQLV